MSHSHSPWSPRLVSVESRGEAKGGSPMGAEDVEMAPHVEFSNAMAIAEANGICFHNGWVPSGAVALAMGYAGQCLDCGCSWKNKQAWLAERDDVIAEWT